MRTTATLIIGNHGFTVKDYNDEFYSKARAYCARFVKYRIESKVVQGRRSFVKVPDRVFGSASKDRKELHINCLAEFKQFMLNSGWNPERFKEITRELPEGRDVNSNDHQVAVPVRERSFWKDILCHIQHVQTAEAHWHYVNAEVHHDLAYWLT
ncbi:hypothetical protein ACTFIT_012350 [Dictyostelium discoideum]